jgi:uncharacterized protein YbaP (TraB family)
MLLCLGGSGCSDDGPPPIEDAFLWRVEVDGRSTYLLGTIHRAVAAEELPESVWNAFEEAEVFSAETDLREPIADDELVRYGLLPEDVILEDLLPAEAWTELVRLLSDELPADALQVLQPWLVSIFVGQELLPDDGDVAMDLRFTEEAATAGKELLFLERFADVAALELEIPLEEQALDLAALLANPDAYREGVALLEAVYRDGDRALMRTLLGADSNETDPADELFLRRRNEAWLPQIEQQLQKPMFIAVGLAHLLGPYDLLDMLAESGYQAEYVGAAIDAEVAALRQASTTPPHSIAPLPAWQRRLLRRRVTRWTGL